MTAEGYYLSSPNGAALFSWRENGRMRPLLQERPHLHDPEKVRQAMHEETTRGFGLHVEP
jgi:hypothetical protein